MCMNPLQVVALFCTLLYSPFMKSRYSIFQAHRMSESKGKSSDYVASTAMLFKVLYHKSKNVFLIFCVCCVLFM